MPKKHPRRLFLRILFVCRPCFRSVFVSLRSVQNKHQLDAVNRCKSDVPRTSCDPARLAAWTACETSFRFCRQKNQVSQILRYLIFSKVLYADVEHLSFICFVIESMHSCLLQISHRLDTFLYFYLCMFRQKNLKHLAGRKELQRLPL